MERIRIDLEIQNELSVKGSCVTAAVARKYTRWLLVKGEAACEEKVESDEADITAVVKGSVERTLGQKLSEVTVKVETKDAAAPAAQEGGSRQEVVKLQLTWKLRSQMPFVGEEVRMELSQVCEQSWLGRQEDEEFEINCNAPIERSLRSSARTNGATSR